MQKVAKRFFNAANRLFVRGVNWRTSWDYLSYFFFETTANALTEGTQIRRGYYVLQLVYKFCQTRSVANKRRNGGNCVNSGNSSLGLDHWQISNNLSFLFNICFFSDECCNVLLEYKIELLNYFSINSIENGWLFSVGHRYIQVYARVRTLVLIILPYTFK